MIRINDTAQKDKILGYINDHAEEQLQFVIDLCNQNSYTTNKTGSDRVAEMILNRLDGCFNSHNIIPQIEFGNHHILRMQDDLPSIILLGHMDTVFPPDHGFQTCRREGDFLYGPGTGDMKGGLAVFVYAIKALQASDLLGRIPITFILGSDEEIGSMSSRFIYEKENKKAAACLVAECGGLNGKIVVSRNGKMGIRIESFGQDRHVGEGTHRKSSAILELAHKIIGVESLNTCLPGISVNVGKIEGGLGPCTVPKNAFALVDIRWEDQDHQNMLLNKLKNIVDQFHQEGCLSKFNILNSRPAMPVTEGTMNLFNLIQEVGKELDQRIQKTHRRGTSDANFFGAANIPTIDGLGPISQKDHTSDECIMISSLIKRTALISFTLIALEKNRDSI